MMLLAAVVLIIGFVALAGMVSRVSQLASQTTKEQDRPLLREIEPMLGAVNSAIDSSATGRGLGSIAPAITYPSAAYDNAVAALLRHLRAIEAGQGILMDWTMTCGGASSYATITLSDGFLSVTVRSNSFTRPPACSPLSG